MKLFNESWQEGSLFSCPRKKKTSNKVKNRKKATKKYLCKYNSKQASRGSRITAQLRQHPSDRISS